MLWKGGEVSGPPWGGRIPEVVSNVFLHLWLSSHLGFFVLLTSKKGICTFLETPSQMGPPYRYLLEK